MAKEKFETALARIEKIVEELESGELPLEEMLKKYEEGVKLAAFCTATLNEAEKKIEILSKNAKGEFETRPFEAEGEVPEDSPRKRSSRRKEPDGEETF